MSIGFFLLAGDTCIHYFESKAHSQKYELFELKWLDRFVERIVVEIFLVYSKQIA